MEQGITGLNALAWYWKSSTGSGFPREAAGQ
ncbi:uncharacterized protein G2W53_026708 [Senna tora]|uniref:Uncharacterized protein n=1 Tax=Senna tora TaxID=362788 RepID=A0A834WHP2_9FABA|nr:uncharacterized protein G2W53_026708 [Senna tora]